MHIQCSNLSLCGKRRRSFLVAGKFSRVILNELKRAILQWGDCTAIFFKKCSSIFTEYCSLLAAILQLASSHNFDKVNTVIFVNLSMPL